MDLSGKTVFFVGALGGIGFETSKTLMTKNLKNLVILEKVANDDLLQTLQAIAPATNVFFFKFDVTMSRDAMKTILNEIFTKVEDTIDIFIYGAGICNDQLPELCIQINLTGMVHAVSLVMPLMDKRNGGKGGMIVNIASAAGLDPFHSLPIYSATKSAMISFSRSLADPVIYSQTGIAFVIICPGITITPILQSIHGFLNVNDSLNDAVKQIPGQSAEICGKNLVTAIEKGQNAAIWLLDDGRIDLVELQSFWQMREDVSETLSKTK